MYMDISEIIFIFVWLQIKAFCEVHILRNVRDCFLWFKQSTIKLLVAAGANVNLQTGSFRGNVSALMLAAAKGHLDVVKELVELKALPDKKGGSQQALFV